MKKAINFKESIENLASKTVFYTSENRKIISTEKASKLTFYLSNIKPISDIEVYIEVENIKEGFDIIEYISENRPETTNAKNENPIFLVGHIHK